MAFRHVAGSSPRRSGRERRREVHVERQAFRAGGGTHERRPAHEQGYSQALFVHEALVVEAVVAEEEPLVGRVDDDRVALEAASLQEVGQASEGCPRGRSPLGGPPARPARDFNSIYLRILHLIPPPITVNDSYYVPCWLRRSGW